MIEIRRKIDLPRTPWRISLIGLGGCVIACCIFLAQLGCRNSVPDKSNQRKMAEESSIQEFQFKSDETDPDKLVAEIRAFIGQPGTYLVDYSIDSADESVFGKYLTFNFYDKGFDIVQFRAEHGGFGLELLGEKILSRVTDVWFDSKIDIQDYEEFLMKLSNLESFRLLKAGATTDLSNFDWPKLERLDVSGAEIRGKNCFGLSAPNLRDVNADHSDFGDEDIEVILNRFLKLKQLSIQYTNVSPEQILRFLAHPTMISVTYTPKGFTNDREYLETMGKEKYRLLFNNYRYLDFHLPAIADERRRRFPEDWQYYQKHGHFRSDLLDGKK